MKQLQSAALFGAVVLTFTACNYSGPNISTAPPEQKPDPKPVSVQEHAPPSPWHLSTSKNDVTGEQTTTAVNDYTDEQGIVIRQIGKKLEFYIRTGRFLETVENMHSNLSVVAYKFDDGPIVRQSWGMSTDNEGLFYPGNPSAFLNKMRKAKRFAIEYKPADVVAQTVSFDVSQFPVEFSPRESRSK